MRAKTRVIFQFAVHAAVGAIERQYGSLLGDFLVKGPYPRGGEITVEQTGKVLSDDETLVLSCMQGYMITHFKGACRTVIPWLRSVPPLRPSRRARNRKHYPMKEIVSFEETSDRDRYVGIATGTSGDGPFQWFGRFLSVDGMSTAQDSGGPFLQVGERTDGTGRFPQADFRTTLGSQRPAQSAGASLIQQRLESKHDGAL